MLLEVIDYERFDDIGKQVLKEAFDTMVVEY
jgi:hypothetical protein